MHNKYTRKRDTIITLELLSKRRYLYLHKGKSFTMITLTHEMIGHKLGEFSLTKRIGARIHKTERNTKRKNKNKQK